MGRKTNTNRWLCPPVSAVACGFFLCLCLSLFYDVILKTFIPCKAKLANGGTRAVCLLCLLMRQFSLGEKFSAAVNIFRIALTAAS